MLQIRAYRPLKVINIKINEDKLQRHLPTHKQLLMLSVCISIAQSKQNEQERGKNTPYK